jgi:hypothetical protein
MDFARLYPLALAWTRVCSNDTKINPKCQPYPRIDDADLRRAHRTTLDWEAEDQITE